MLMYPNDPPYFSRPGALSVRAGLIALVAIAALVVAALLGWL